MTFRMNELITVMRQSENKNTVWNAGQYADFIKNIPCDLVLLKAEKNSEQNISNIPVAMIYFKITIRSCELHKKITSFDRLRNVRTGEIFEITWIQELSNKRYIEIQAKKADDQSIYKQ